MPKTRAYHALVKAKDYNGSKDVLFMMKSDDHRFGTDNYETIGRGTFAKGILTVCTDTDRFKMYRVFPDWSVRAI